MKKKLIVLTLFFFLGLSGCSEKQCGVSRSFDDLVAALREAEGKASESHPVLQMQVLAMEEEARTWSLKELKTVIENRDFLFGVAESDIIVAEWGKRRKGDAVDYFLDMVDKERDQTSTQHYGVGGDSERSLFLGSVGLCLNQVLAGWARVDPKAAWNELKDPNGRIARTEGDSLDGYQYLAPIKIFEHLAAADPDFAVKEFLSHPDLLFRGSMLKGMSKGLPKGYDWKGLFEVVLKSPDSSDHELTAPMRGSLLGRWMQDDAEEAIAWFHSEAGKAISTQKNEFFFGNMEDGQWQVVISQVSIGGAVRHWLAKDWQEALEWLGGHPGLIEEVVKKHHYGDPDFLRASDLRQVLKEVLPKSPREKVLAALIDKKLLGDLFPISETAGLTLDGWTPEVTKVIKTEIRELEVSSEFEKKLLEELMKEPEENDDPFASDSKQSDDPFAN